MKKKNPYNIFDRYVLRTPLFSFSSYKKLTAHKEISDYDLKNYCNNSVFKEAIFLATPSFYKEMDKWFKNEITDLKKKEKVKLTILKYLSRMSSRCTPFGLFAGCSVGGFENKTKIKLKNVNENHRHTRLDMEFLVALSQDLAKNKIIRKQLLFFKNTNIYKLGNQLRYVEYNYLLKKRQHQITAVEDSGYLSKTLERATNGVLLIDLVNDLIDDEITKEDAYVFIEELVSSQLLVSELDANVSGIEFFYKIFSILEKMKGIDEILLIFQEIKVRIDKLDNIIGNNPQDYLDLSENLKKLKIDFDPNVLFQTDLVISNDTNTLDKSIMSDLKKGLMILNKMALPSGTSRLTKFKDAFYERYEEREVSLLKALDVEVGIGYTQNQFNNGDLNPLVDDIILHKKQDDYSVKKIEWTAIDTIIQSKLFQAYKHRSYIITLKDNDFKEFEAVWEDLPDTFSCLIEIGKIEGKQKIKFSGFGGSSAANLLARFCFGDKNIYDLTNEIITKETQINNNKILAEIVHLPESRVGNVMLRPDFLEYEIPFLANSLKPQKKQLPLEDLTLSMGSDKRIILKSRKYDMEIVPRLTNAHNYTHNSLPIYNFLADMQTQNIRDYIVFGLGYFATEYEFIPRFEYNNLILSVARWNLNGKHIAEILKHQDDDDRLFKELKTLRESLFIPQYVLLIEGDNELLINLENLTSLRMLLNIINKRKNFTLFEFLFNDSDLIQRKNEYFTNQIIVSFYNDTAFTKGN